MDTTFKISETEVDTEYLALNSWKFLNNTLRIRNTAQTKEKRS